MLTLASDDQFIGITNASCQLETIIPGEALTIPGAFEFVVSTLVTDQRDLLFSAELISGESIWFKSLHFEAHAPDLKVKSYNVETADGILYPGETPADNHPPEYRERSDQ
jgi:hypothetical protein